MYACVYTGPKSSPLIVGFYGNAPKLHDKANRTYTCNYRMTTGTEKPNVEA